MGQRRFNNRVYISTGKDLSKSGANTLVKMWKSRGYYARRTKNR